MFMTPIKETAIKIGVKKFQTDKPAERAITNSCVLLKSKKVITEAIKIVKGKINGSVCGTLNKPKRTTSKKLTYSFEAALRNKSITSNSKIKADKTNSTAKNVSKNLFAKYLENNQGMRIFTLS